MNAKSLNAFDTVCAARMSVYRRLPYFMKMLYKLIPVEQKDAKTFFVDERLRVHYNPELVLKSGIEFVGTFLAHEVQHPLREHMTRGRRWIDENTARWEKCQGGLAAIHPLLGESPMVMWNVVGDLEINPVLDEAGFKFPADFAPFYPKSLDLPPAKFAEEWADMLFERAEKNPQPKKPTVASLVAMLFGDGSCGGCSGNPHPAEAELDESGAPAGSTPTAVEIARRQVAHDVLEPTEEMKRLMGQSGIGKLPGGLEAWAKAQLAPPEAPWQKILGPLVRRAVSYARGRVDWKFGRPSRRREVLKQTLGEEAPLLPTLVAPVPNVGIVVDTSGSMSATGKSNRTLLDEAISEVVGIVLATGCPCWAAPVDTVVNEWVLIRSKADANKLFKGGGGTDMRVGIAAADAKRFDVAVLVTDGETDWPAREEMPRHTRLVTCIVGDAKAPAHMTPLVRVQSEKTTKGGR